MTSFDITIFISIFIVLLTVIGINALIIKFILQRAVRKFVKPELASKGLIFLGYHWVGFTPSNTTPMVFTKGKPAITIYADIQFLNKGVTKKATIKIDTFFYFITKVVYSDNLT